MSRVSSIFSKAAVDTSRKRTLYLHFGAHRTATTSIQEVLKLNSDVLTKSGFRPAFEKGRHLGLFNDLFAKRLAVRDLAQSLLNDAPQAPTIIMSDEDVGKQADLTPLGLLSEWFDIKVVFALRRQDLWLESWWSQNVKSQWDPSLANISFQNFLADRSKFHWVDYDRYLGHMEQVFGKENLRTYVFEKGQMPNGAVETFFEQIGYGKAARLKQPAVTNESMSPAMSEIMRHLPLYQTNQLHRRRLVRALFRANKQVAANSPSKLILPYEERVALMQEYAPGNAAVARRYFGREELFLEPLPSPDQPVADLSLNPAGEEMIRLVLRPFIEGLIEIEAKKPQAAKRPAMLRPARSQA